ncbi:MAG: MDR family MFS transporter, partial [Syntrophothermus sp.]
LLRRVRLGSAGEMPRLIWILALGGLISSIGAAFVWPLNTIYIHFYLEKPLTVAGLVLMLQAGAGIAGQLAGGALFDKFGGKVVMVTGLFLAAGMLTVIGLVRVWPVYVVAMGFLGVSYGLIDPATNALVAHAWPEGGRHGFNFLYVARNAGVAIGTAIGGILAGISFRLAFLGNAAAAFVYLLLVLRSVPKKLPVAQEKMPDHSTAGTENSRQIDPGEGSTEKISATNAVNLGLIALGVSFIWMSYAQWQAVISVYMRTLGYSLAAYSLLWTINGVLIVAGQPLIIAVVKRWLKGLRAEMISGTLLFAAAFVLIWRHPRYEWFIAGMVILTLGEMLVLPALPAAVGELAPKGRMGLFQGVLGGAASAGRMLGPVGGGAMYDRWSPPGVLAAAALLCFAAAGLFGLYSAIHHGSKRVGT